MQDVGFDKWVSRGRHLWQSGGRDIESRHSWRQEICREGPTDLDEETTPRGSKLHSHVGSYLREGFYYSWTDHRIDPGQLKPYVWEANLFVLVCSLVAFASWRVVSAPRERVVVKSMPRLFLSPWVQERDEEAPNLTNSKIYWVELLTLEYFNLSMRQIPKFQCDTLNLWFG